MNAVVKGIEPKQWFSFSLAAQFPSQKRDFSRHPWFGYEPFCYPFRYGASVAQAGLLSFHENMTEVRPLGSTGITPLPRYYGPLRIPTVNARRVMDSPPAALPSAKPFRFGFSSGLPGSSADLSTRALPNHPGQSHRFLRSFIPGEWQASPSSGGWPLSFERNEAESGSLSLGSRLRRPGRCLPFALRFLARTGLTPHVRLPSRDRPRLHVERAIHMSDSFQSDRSTRLGLAYQRRKDRGENPLYFVDFFACFASLRYKCSFTVLPQFPLVSEPSRQNQYLVRYPVRVKSTMLPYFTRTVILAASVFGTSFPEGPRSPAFATVTETLYEPSPEIAVPV